MINSHRNKALGAVTLVFTLILMVLSTLIIVFAANYGQMQDKMIGNLHRNHQAFTAAEAGLEFGINYLLSNRSTIVGSPSASYITPYSDSNTTNITFGNNSKFTVVFTNPVANNFNLITVTSTGTSDDSSATRTVAQNVQYGSLFATPPTTPIISLDNVDLGGSSTITNSESDETIISGGNVSLSGASSTINQGGVASTASTTGSDIEENDPTLSSQSQAQFFKSFFGASKSVVKSNFATTYTATSDSNFSSNLNGKSNTTIWIEQSNGTTTLNGTITIGTPSQPVFLVVNGNLRISGNVTFYGVLFVTGTSNQDLSGSIVLSGAVVSASELNIKGSAVINFNSSILQTVQTLPNLSYYARVAGTWRDF